MQASEGVHFTLLSDTLWLCLNTWGCHFCCREGARGASSPSSSCRSPEHEPVPLLRLAGGPLPQWLRLQDAHWRALKEGLDSGTRAAVQTQGREHTFLILEQSSHYRFNRGALLNVGVLFLSGSDFDYFAFHDVDTIPTERGNIQYDYPSGHAPLHLTPPGIHPNVRYEVCSTTALPQESTANR